MTQRERDRDRERGRRREGEQERDAEGGLRGLFVSAAREILDESDTALELRKVAERAGKSRTAPYLAFGKAEDGGGLPALQMAVASDGFRSLEEELEGAMDHARSPEDALEGVAAAYLGFARAHPRLFRHMFGHEVSRALVEPPGCAPAAREQRELLQARVRLEGAIGRLVAEQHPAYLREVPGEDLDTMAAALWAMIHGVAVLTIDEQWGLGGLGEEDARRQAGRALRFLTTASSDAMREVAQALQLARVAKMKGLGWKRRKLSSLESPLDSAREAVPEATYGEPSRALKPEIDEEVSPARGPWHRFSERSARYERSPASEGPRGMPLRSRVARGGSDPRSALLRRVSVQAERARGRTVLWIDDQPEMVHHEREMLEALGMRVLVADSSLEAFEFLDRFRPDLVISDVARGRVADEGIRVLPALRALAEPAKVILYVARFDPEAPIPAGAFGITNDPEELLHLVLDAVERE